MAHDKDRGRCAGVSSSKAVTSRTGSRCRTPSTATYYMVWMLSMMSTRGQPVHIGKAASILFSDERKSPLGHPQPVGPHLDLGGGFLRRYVKHRASFPQVSTPAKQRGFADTDRPHQHQGAGTVPPPAPGPLTKPGGPGASSWEAISGAARGRASETALRRSVARAPPLRQGYSTSQPGNAPSIATTHIPLLADVPGLLLGQWLPPVKTKAKINTLG